MNFIVIPFLLAANLDTNDDAWNYGPEYTFGVRASMIASMEMDDDGLHNGHSLLVKLKCRPNELDRLTCRFEEPRITRLTPQKLDSSETIPPRNATYEKFGFAAEKNFEIKFDESGIVSYTFDNTERKMEGPIGDMYRMIGNQLSVGTFLEGKADKFQALENFTMGECVVDYEITREKLRSGKRYDEADDRRGKRRSKARRKTFDLVPRSALRLVDADDDDEIVQLQKTRDPNNCYPHELYFFGTRYVYGIVLRESIDKLVSSTSRMIFSKTSFTTETMNMVDIYDLKDNKIGSVLDHIHLSLDSIAPAQGSLKSIPNQKIVDVIIRGSYNRGGY